MCYKWQNGESPLMFENAKNSLLNDLEIPGLSHGPPSPLCTHPWCWLFTLSFLPLLLEITGTLLTVDSNVSFMLLCYISKHRYSTSGVRVHLLTQ